MSVNDSREQIRQAYKISDNDAPTKMIPATKKININKKACYAQQSKRRQIREVMINEMRNAVQKSGILELCTAIISESIEKSIVEKCAPIMQVDNVFVTKIKVIKAPTFSVEELKKLHQGRNVQKASAAARPEEEAAPAEGEAPAPAENTQ